MRRARLFSFVLVMVVAACGREGGDRDTGQLAARPSVTPRASTAPAETMPPRSGGPATARPSGATAVDATAPPASSARPATTPSAAPRLVRPTTGRYGFHEKGTRRAGSGGQDQPYETDGSLTVSASGERTTLRFATDNGSEEMTLRYETSRAFLERARLQQSVASFDARFDPPQLILRAPMNLGDTWTNTWKSGATSGTTKIRIDREELVRAFGKVWRAVVVVNQSTASGEAKGNTSTTSWYVAELGLDVKRISDFDGTYQGIAFKQHAERVLTSRP